MQFLKTQSDGRTILALDGDRLDAQVSGELRDKILALLDGGAVDLIVDLSSVAFIDSSGLGALLSGFKNASLRSGSFVLVGLQPRVQSMFELTRLEKVFQIYPTVESVLNKT